MRIMKKFNLSLIVIVLLTFKGYSQADSTKSLARKSKIEITKYYKKLYIGVGGVYSSFQDVKYSNVRYSGTGKHLYLGYEKSKNPLWGIDFNLILSKEKAKTYTVGKATIYDIGISAKYLHPIMKNETGKLFLGVTWDAFDLYLRSIEDLQNNGSDFILASNIKISSVYERRISTDLKLQAGIDLQIFGFIKQLNSFAYSSPQDALEDGKFSYQDEKLREYVSFKYSSFEPLWNYFNIGTSLKLHYKKRWSLAYKWNMQRSNKVKNYPMTIGYNSISITYNIINKLRK